MHKEGRRLCKDVPECSKVLRRNFVTKVQKKKVVTKGYRISKILHNDLNLECSMEHTST